jgi:hypothetical protein
MRTIVYVGLLVYGTCLDGLPVVQTGVFPLRLTTSNATLEADPVPV